MKQATLSTVIGLASSGLHKLAELPLASPDLTRPTDANSAASALANRVIDILLVVTVPLLIVAVVWSAFNLFKVTGKPDDIAQVKKNLWYLVIGLFLIIFAVPLIRSFYGFFRP